MSDFLNIRHVHKSFPYGKGRIHVLRDLSLTLQPGIMATIVGHSGSGKSTLLHVVGGMESPDEGDVIINGIRFYNLSGDERAHFRNREIGFVFQFHHLLPEFNAVENLIMPLRIRGQSRSQAHSKGEMLLEEIGLSGRKLNRPGELSGGEQQRLAIGRALITEPSLLLMDEPTGNLDHNTSDEIMALVGRVVAKRGLTVVLVTHNISLAERGDQRFRMVDGVLINMHT